MIVSKSSYHCSEIYHLVAKTTRLKSPIVDQEVVTLTHLDKRCLLLSMHECFQTTDRPQVFCEIAGCLTALGQRVFRCLNAPRHLRLAGCLCALGHSCLCHLCPPPGRAQAMPSSRRSTTGPKSRGVGGSINYVRYMFYT